MIYYLFLIYISTQVMLDTEVKQLTQHSIELPVQKLLSCDCFARAYKENGVKNQCQMPCETSNL